MFNSKSLLTGALISSAFAFAACDIDKTKDGELPDVKVEGKVELPEYDVDGPEVTTGTKKVEIEVPTVDVDIPDEEDNEPNTTNED